MIWHLLWLYPLIGAVVAPWLYKGESKRDRFGGNPDRVAMVLAVIILWPALMFVVPSEWRDSDTYWAVREASEMEALLESVRQERLAPDPRLAEFDILLGIEPVQREAIRVPAARDRFVEALGAPMGYARGGYIEDFRLCDVVEFRVKGIPTITEINQGVDIQAKVI